MYHRLVRTRLLGQINGIGREYPFVGVTLDKRLPRFDLATYNKIHCPYFKEAIDDDTIDVYNELLLAYVAGYTDCLEAVDTEDTAKKTLSEVLGSLQQMDLGDIKTSNIVVYTDFLRELPNIYFELSREHYCNACIEVVSYIQKNCLGLARVRNGLIMTLSEGGKL